MQKQTNLLFAGKESSLQARNPTRKEETKAGTTQLTALVKGSTCKPFNDWALPE